MNAHRGVQSHALTSVELICHVDGYAARLLAVCRYKNAGNAGSLASLQDLLRADTGGFKFSVIDMCVSIKELRTSAVINGLSHVSYEISEPGNTESSNSTTR